MDNLKEFYGPNAGYIQEMYERFLRDPASVDPQAAEIFARWARSAVEEQLVPGIQSQDMVGYARKVAGAVGLARALREHGHLAAHLDPLDSHLRGDPALDPGYHGVSEADLAEIPANIIDGPVAEEGGTALDVINGLRQIYCGHTGYEFGHVQDYAEREWLRDAVESGRFCEACQPVADRAILKQLTDVEALERFLQRTFPGQTRFSLEGNDMLVPMLDDLIGCSAEEGNCEVIIGMAHRGRLNVLAHVLRKPYANIISEFHGAVPGETEVLSEGTYEGWTGDVKYHLGARRAVVAGEVVGIVVILAPNPSHLEYVNPVVEGMARAGDDGRNKPGAPPLYRKATVPILVHGDAAFPGQGIVAETLNLSRLDGYETGGTIHIIVNNQLGFTTDPKDGRSTLYASDLAKGFSIPIIHVNADDPIACTRAERLAQCYRNRFHKDFLVDLIGYRRRGHNEGDEPSFTQPKMYDVIESHPTVRELWASDLIRRGVIAPDEAEMMVRTAYERVQEARAELARSGTVAEEEPQAAPTTPDRVETAVPLSRLQQLNQSLYALPEGFTVNPKLERVFERRRSAVPGAGPIDWGHAENLAFASILADGTPIRLTGQDTERGTFNQRHVVVHDQKTGVEYVPLQKLPQARASFAIYDSPLSENAVLGFEYGYSIMATDTLVLWEAQYGDFANSAQVMIDQFIASGSAKWNQTPSLGLLLPHGYEGQGPEHSSARLERFLSLAADDSIVITNCTTSAQYFHLLRRHAALLTTRPRPLVMLTPKSLLRHPLAASRVEEFAQGRFYPVLDDEAARGRAPEITRLILCSGKIYFDLVSTPERDKAGHVAVVRLEQLFPLPVADIEMTIDQYPSLQEVVWLQEEPKNMGAWSYLQPKLSELVGSRAEVRYIGRPERASPAEGLPEWHALQQERIVQEALAGVPSPQQTVRRSRRAS